MKGKPRAAAPPRRPIPKWLDVLGVAALSLAALGGWLALDPRSIDGFTAPKLLAIEIGLAAAAAVLLAAWKPAGPLPRGLRAPLALAGLAVAWSLLSAAVSRHPSESLLAVARALLVALALPVGYSRWFARRRGYFAWLYLAGAAANAVLVILAARHIYDPIALSGAEWNQRAMLGALVGNPGQLGVALAIAVVAAADLALGGRTAGRRAAAATLALLAAGGALATQTLSTWPAALAGLATLALIRFGRKGLAAIAALLLAAAAAAALTPPLRQRALRVAREVRTGQWSAAVTGRTVVWFSAAEMIRLHPLVGVGPGNFEAAYVPARLSAERRLRRWLGSRDIPTANYERAHDDYLDLAAATGIPGALLWLAALGSAVAVIWRRRGRHALAVLATALTAALVWFPFQIPVAALWIFLSLGHGARGEAPEEAA